MSKGLYAISVTNRNSGMQFWFGKNNKFKLTNFANSLKDAKIYKYRKAAEKKILELEKSHRVNKIYNNIVVIDVAMHMACS